MIACPALSLTGSLPGGLAALDCSTGEATAYAFGRLFGSEGRLLPALTILLTLYIGFFAVSLLTGRSRLGLSALTPRMLTLGLVLTFATSWAAYQSTIWTLATGAPDQIAGILIPGHGSATAAFADRLDGLFGAVADAADAATKPAAPTETGITPAATTVGGFSASTVLGVSALMLMLGTVGVLVTSKIVLAALLALGPVFVVLALFAGTRGLFEGWLKAVVLFALVPLFAVLIGSGAVAVLSPLAGDLAMEGAQPEARAVAAMFLGASVYLALMVMTVKTAATLVGGWRLPGAGRGRDGQPASRHAPAQTVLPPMLASASDAAGTYAASPTRGGDERVRAIVAAIPAASGESGGGGEGPSRARVVSGGVRSVVDVTPLLPASDARRSREIGHTVRPRPMAVERRGMR